MFCQYFSQKKLNLKCKIRLLYADGSRFSLSHLREYSLGVGHLDLFDEKSGSVT
jgi:hypothetical protein